MKVVEETERTSRYLHKTKIARGGRSTIYRVFDDVLRRWVAMKVIEPEVNAISEESKRFVEEAQITAQLDHPNIIPVYDQDVDDAGLPCFTLKLVQGKTLLELFREENYNPGEESELYEFLRIFDKVCDAVSFAHSQGVIHRDLKPENIMVGSHGQVYLMDFGLLRMVRQEVDGSVEEDASPTESTVNILRDTLQFDLDREGEAVGSYFYLPPEQASGTLAQIDERTDIFALGAILYELLTKCPIYMGLSHEDLLEQALSCQIEPPQELSPYKLPRELCNIAMRALQKRREDRYPSVEALQRDLAVFFRGSGKLPNETFQRGALVTREGHRGDKAYLLVRGQCRVSKWLHGKQEQVRELGPGDVFGETAAFSSRKRTATVEAVTDIVVKVIDREILEQELGFGSWVSRVLSALAQRFAEIDAETVSLRGRLSMSVLLNQLQLQLLRFGSRVSHRSMETAWSQLRRELCDRLRVSPEECRRLLEEFEFVTIDDSNDRLSFDLLRGQEYLASLES